MLRTLTILLLFLGIATAGNAQDPIFSQFYAAPLQLNPAFAGTTYEPRITLNYRNQWPSIENAYVTYAASYEQFMENLNSGFGVQVSTDSQGDGVYKVNRFGATYSYQVAVNKEIRLKFGVEAAFQQSSVDWNRLVFLDQIDPITGFSDGNGNPILSEEVRPINTTNSLFDVSTGILAYSRDFFVGFSAKHLNTPDESILDSDANLSGGLPMRLTLHGGYQLNLGGNKRGRAAFVSPNAAYIRHGDQTQINVGAYAGFSSIFAGVWYRHANSNRDAAIALIGYQYDIFKIGYSYDFTISELAVPGSGGAHEISVTLNFDESEAAKRRRRNSRYNDCFRFLR
ncbi:MAG: type IX secretion system membrane protein PorP/SprF [Saprospiraceae bacterium]